MTPFVPILYQRGGETVDWNRFEQAETVDLKTARSGKNVASDERCWQRLQAGKRGSARLTHTLRIEVVRQNEEEAPDRFLVRGFVDGKPRVRAIVDIKDPRLVIGVTIGRVFIESVAVCRMVPAAR